MAPKHGPIRDVNPDQPPERDPLAAAIEDTFKQARKDGMSVTIAAEAVAEAIREHLAKEQAPSDDPHRVRVQSVVSHRSGDPLVQCRVGFEQWQWDVESARQHALFVLEAAEAAEAAGHDAAMWRWMTLGHLGLTKGQAAHALGELRRFRGDVAREDWLTPHD